MIVAIAWAIIGAFLLFFAWVIDHTPPLHFIDHNDLYRLRKQRDRNVWRALAFAALAFALALSFAAFAALRNGL